MEPRLGVVVVVGNVVVVVVVEDDVLGVSSPVVTGICAAVVDCAAVGC